MSAEIRTKNKTHNTAVIAGKIQLFVPSQAQGALQAHQTPGFDVCL
jgi:hypothetical protein